MKKFLAFFIALLPLFASAQYFVLTPDGFVSTEDNTKNYVVIQIEGSQQELYNKAKTAITSMWTSPKDVMSYNEPDIIIVNGFKEDLVAKASGIKLYFDIVYRLQFQFKDGKIRVNAPGVDQATKGANVLFFGKGGGKSFFNIYYVFDKKGNLKQKDFKKEIETYFDTIINTLVEKMKSGGVSDDW